MWWLLLACAGGGPDSGDPGLADVVLPAGPAAVVRLSRTVDGTTVSGHPDPGSLCPPDFQLLGFDGLFPVCASLAQGAAVAVTHRADGTPLNRSAEGACAAGWSLVGWDDQRAWCHAPGPWSVAAVDRLADGAAFVSGTHACPGGWTEVGAAADLAWCVRPGARPVLALAGVGTEPIGTDALTVDACPGGTEGIGFLDTAVVCVGLAEGVAVELSRSPEGTSLAAAAGDPAGVCGAPLQAVGFRGDRAVCSGPAGATPFALTRDLNGVPRVSGPDEGRVCPPPTTWVGGRGEQVVCLGP